MKERIIFHIDVNNAFLSWTAVLLLKKGYDIDIRTIPTAIGGSEANRHGIILAKSPIAKKYNIVTAETIYQAKKKCSTLKVYPPNYQWYYEKSRELFNYLTQYCPIVEKFSVDECFLDMSGTHYLYNDYKLLADHIKKEIKQKFGYTVNIGIANNKLCAKMASDFEKPDKVHTLYEEEIETKLWPLDVGELFMVGKKGKEVLNRLNILTIEDLAKTNQELLKHYFKNQAKYLKEAAWGIDNSKVAPRNSKTNSISISETLPYDHVDGEILQKVLFRQTEEVTRELREQHQYAKTVAVIYKNNQFKSYSAQAKLSNATHSTKDIYKLVLELFNKSYKKDPIRLIGVRLADLSEKQERQLSLFEEVVEEDNEIQKTIDNINERFGKSLIAPASLKLVEKSTREKLKK